MATWQPASLNANIYKLARWQGGFDYFIGDICEAIFLSFVESCSKSGGCPACIDATSALTTRINRMKRSSCARNAPSRCVSCLRGAAQRFPVTGHASVCAEQLVRYCFVAPNMLEPLLAIRAVRCLSCIDLALIVYIEAIAQGGDSSCTSSDVAASASVVLNRARASVRRLLDPSDEWMEDSAPCCSWRGALPDLLPHLEGDCPYVCTLCPTVGCAVIGPRVHVNHHSTSCRSPHPYPSLVVVAQGLTDRMDIAESTV